MAEACRNLAELGIGTNDKASRPDNVLEAEKILGTIHLALGDNTGFGGIILKNWEDRDRSAAEIQVGSSRPKPPIAASRPRSSVR